MAREWQQTKMTEYVLPDPVYYQCLWAIRDLERLENKLSELEEDIKAGVKGKAYVNEGRRDYCDVKPTEINAIEKVNLERRINSIKKAFAGVPDSYKGYVMDSILNKVSPKKRYPDNIWKIWKQRFVYSVAVNLNLI